jgi:antigen flippase
LSLRKLLLDITHTSGTKIYGLLIGLATVSLTARWLGPEGRGQLVVATTWIGLLAMLGHLSLGQVAIHRASQNREETWLPSVLGSLLFLAAASSLVIVVGVGIAYAFTDGAVFNGVTGKTALLICVALPFFVWEYHGSALLISQGKITRYNLWLASGRTLALAVLFVIVYWAGYGVIGGVVAAIIGQILIAGGILYSLTKIVPVRSFVAKSEVLALLKGGAKLHLNAIGVLVFGTIDVLLINRYRNAEEAAYYQIAVQLVGVMLVIPQSVAMVLYGQVASAGPNAAWPQYKRVVMLTVAVICSGGVLAWILAPLIVSIVAGSAFEPAVDLFRWLLLALAGMTFSTTMAPQWIGRGFFAQAAGITIMVGAISTLANLILIPKYGAKGAVLAAIGSYSIAVICNLAMVAYCDRHAKLAR